MEEKDKRIEAMDDSMKQLTANYVKKYDIMKRINEDLKFQIQNYDNAIVELPKKIEALKNEIKAKND